MIITTINSVEISSVCDNACQYCPAPLQALYRDVGLMTMDAFRRVIDWVKYFCEQGTQKELNLFGVGEPLLNPEIVAMVAHARLELPPMIPLHLNTNGNKLTLAMAESLKRAGITSIDITAHKPYQAARAIRIFKSKKIPYSVSFDPILHPNNWAGQVNWFKPDYPAIFPCPWVGNGQVMIMSDGRVTRCCIDAFAKGVLGSVDDDLRSIDVTSFSLCAKCHHTLTDDTNADNSKVGGV